MVQQSDHRCVCGSWYHENGICKCGRPVVVPPNFYAYIRTQYTQEKRAPHGVGWNKKQHKVEWN